MRNTFKIARWEIKKNLNNKSFLIGLFITPVLFLLFGFLGSWLGGEPDDEQTVKIYVRDELNVFTGLEETIKQHELPVELEKTEAAEPEAKKALADAENTGYLFVDERAVTEGRIPFYTNEDFPKTAIVQIQLLAEPVKMLNLQRLGLSDEQLTQVTKPVYIDHETASEGKSSGEKGPDLDRIVPGAFAGAVLLSIVFTGMMIFQSASQEKKDKIAEIILSSATPGELMQGKIIGYFVLGLVQVAVFICFVFPFLLWKLSDFPLFEYLFVPELLLFLLIAILGYLLFASIFAGLGATISDISTVGNFQSLVLMIPIISFFFIQPVFHNPDGVLAQVLSYVPFTSPVILLFRLIILEEWSWMEISLSLAVLVISVLLFMKLAGKIFKVGILMYGKNATPGEIWKWLRT